MKRIIAFALTFVLLTGLLSPALAQEPDWRAAYASILDQKQAQAAAEREYYGYFFDYEYTIYDIDKDGVPELIVKLGSCEADYHGEIYTFRNGAALCVCDELGLSHSSLYTDPDENGVVLMQGHMGFAWAGRLKLEGGRIVEEKLYEDDLNERLATDPNADYIRPGEIIPGSVYLNMFRTSLRLPLYHYEEVMNCMAGRFPGAVACGDYPNQDPDFYNKIINGNGEVVAVSADGYARSPGRIGFLDLLKQNVAADWMDEDLKILSAQLADLNGDGQPECIVELSKGDAYNRMRFFLSEQEGTVYAYLQNYASENLSVDQNGNLLCGSEYYAQLLRLIFEREEATLLTLPMDYLAE